MEEGLLSNSPVCYDQLVKILIAIEPYGKFDQNFCMLIRPRAVIDNVHNSWTT